MAQIPVTPIDPYAALKAAERAVEQARYEARQCRETTVAARTAFGKALENWNRVQPVMTQEQMARAFIATSQAERARRAAEGRYRPPLGVTATARAYAGGNSRAGGGRAYARGAYSLAQAKAAEARRK